MPIVKGHWYNKCITVFCPQNTRNCEWIGKPRFLKGSYVDLVDIMCVHAFCL